MNTHLRSRMPCAVHVTSPVHPLFGQTLKAMSAQQRHQGTALGARLSARQEAGFVLSVTDDDERVEADLAAGRVFCPDCGGRLKRWGFARERVLRGLGCELRLRPRRAICGSCGATHVLEPASSIPRLKDSAEVIGAAWQAKVNEGCGHRQIALRLGRPASTVRRWLRRLSRAADRVRQMATLWMFELDSCTGPPEPTGSPLGDALEALGRAVRAAGLRIDPRQFWPTAVALTGGLIASPARARRARITSNPAGADLKASSFAAAVMGQFR